MSNLKQLNRTELFQLKWIWGVIVTCLALWIIVPVKAGQGTLVVGSAVIALLVLAKPLWGARIPGRVWKAVTPALVIWVVFDFVVSSPDLLPPLLRMVILLLLVRAVGPRTAREDLQLLLMAVFVVILAGVLTMSLQFGLQLALFFPAAMFLLFLVNLCQCQEDSLRGPQLWKGFRWKFFIGRVWGSLNLRAIGFASLLFLFVLGTTGLIFVSLPRFQLDQAFPLMNLGGQKTLSGFSDSIRFGEVSDIMEDESVALRVDVPDSGSVPGSPYWRMSVLDEYHGDGFRTSASAKSMTFSDSAAYVGPGNTAEVFRNEGDYWTFYLEPGVSRFLPRVGPFRGLRFQGRQDYQTIYPLWVVALESATSNVLFYQVAGMQHERFFPARNQDAVLMQDERLAYAADHSELLPYPLTTAAIPSGEANQRVLSSAVAEITGGRALSAEEFADEAVRWLAMNHGYSLRSVVPEGEGDLLVRWLAADTPGHCELFAGSFVLLARAAGFPARLVVGFRGGDWNGYENYFMVRNSDAHAWVELFVGEEGWMRVDPTPGAEAASAPLVAEATGGYNVDRTAGAYLDSLRILWYRRIVNFDTAQQQELAENVSVFGKNTLAALKEVAAGYFADASRWASALGTPQGMKLLVRNLLLAVLLWLAVRLLINRILARLRASEGRLGQLVTDPLRRKAGRWLRRLEERGMASDNPGLVEGLRVVRFGPVQEWPETQVLFSRVRKAGRRRRRR